MPTLYVVDDGAQLEREHGRLLVVKQDAVLFAVPFSRLDQVVVGGGDQRHVAGAQRAVWRWGLA